jgi:hypothetical protein
MRDPICLRIIGFNHEGDFRLICLETSVAIQAETLHGANQKMQDAILSYFQTFNKEEIEAGAYLRKASMKYYVMWHMARLSLSWKWITVFFRSFITYDPRSNQLKLA